jgi:hypothetical protein
VRASISCPTHFFVSFLSCVEIGTWYLRLLCGESVWALNPLRTSLPHANLAEHLLSGMLSAAAAIVEPVSTLATVGVGVGAFVVTHDFTNMLL